MIITALTSFTLPVWQCRIVSVREESKQLSIQTKANCKADSGYIWPFISLCSALSPSFSVFFFLLLSNRICKLSERTGQTLPVSLTEFASQSV